MTCVIRNVPVGLGEPSFDKMEAKLAHAMLSIPATKGFEIGSGFRGTCVPGSKHNDPFVGKPDGSLGTSTNWSGGDPLLLAAVSAIVVCGRSRSLSIPKGIEHQAKQKG